MKSAYELVMGRLAADAPAKPLTDAQKQRLAEVDSESNARIAERKIFLEGEIRKVEGDPATQDEMRRQLASEIATIEEKRESRKERIRNEG